MSKDCEGGCDCAVEKTADKMLAAVDRQEVSYSIPAPDGRRWSDGRRWAAGSDSHNLQPLGVPGELTCTGCGIGLLIEGAK